MRYCALFAGLSLIAAASAAHGQVKKGLAVHEWGVFRVSEDEDFANAHLRQEWDKLPPFVYGHIKGRVVPQHWGAIEVRLRPIIFFHAAEPTIVTAWPIEQSGRKFVAGVALFDREGALLARGSQIWISRSRG